jgi:hypothetical protein
MAELRGASRTAPLAFIDVAPYGASRGIAFCGVAPLNCECPMKHLSPRGMLRGAFSSP